MKAAESTKTRARRSYVIERVKIHWGRIPVDLQFSYGEVNVFHFTIVRLHAGGAEGLGEALVHPGEFMLGPLAGLVGQDATRLDTLLPRTDTEVDRISCEGISMALYDLVGRVSGLPLHALLGGKRRHEVPLMPCLFPHDAEEAGLKAEHFAAQGYRRYLKVKLAGRLDEDLARVRAVRAVVPKGLVLQGDANEGYPSPDEAARALKKLGDAGLDVMEDPMRGTPEQYRQLRKSGGAKVMPDALARHTDDLLSVLRAEGADVVGIHPDQPGSLSRAILHARLAQSFGVPVVIGGTGYASVGSAAYQHLTAAAVDDGPCGELGGFFDHGMPRNLVRQTLRVEDGSVEIPDGPGLGVALDEDAVAEFEEGQRQWPQP